MSRNHYFLYFGSSCSNKSRGVEGMVCSKAWAGSLSLTFPFLGNKNDGNAIPVFPVLLAKCANPPSLNTGSGQSYPFDGVPGGAQRDPMGVGTGIGLDPCRRALGFPGGALAVPAPLVKGGVLSLPADLRQQQAQSSHSPSCTQLCCLTWTCRFG